MLPLIKMWTLAFERYTRYSVVINAYAHNCSYVHFNNFLSKKSAGCWCWLVVIHHTSNQILKIIWLHKMWMGIFYIKKLFGICILKKCSVSNVTLVDYPPVTWFSSFFRLLSNSDSTGARILWKLYTPSVRCRLYVSLHFSLVFDSIQNRKQFFLLYLTPNCSISMLFVASSIFVYSHAREARTNDET